MRRFQTLKDEIKFKGIGLHSGLQSTVRLIPCEKQGIFFRTNGGIFSIEQAVVQEDSRLTGFKLPDGTNIRTAEHLLASIAGMGVDGVIIELEGEEMPIMDGSAYPFASAIAETGLAELGGEYFKRALSYPVFASEENANRLVVALPSDKLKVTYVIDYPNTPIGTQRIATEITPENFLNKISKARTFGLTSEIDYLKNAGLAKGGSLDNVVIYSEERILNDNGERFPLEPVTHKILDLLGDLTLTGTVPKAHYICICAGHSAHGRLVCKLKRIFPFAETNI